MPDNKVEEFGKKMQRLGCLLTILITIPVILTIWIGIPGLIAGIVIAALVVGSHFMEKTK